MTLFFDRYLSSKTPLFFCSHFPLVNLLLDNHLHQIIALAKAVKHIKKKPALPKKKVVAKKPKVAPKVAKPKVVSKVAKPKVVPIAPPIIAPLPEQDAVPKKTKKENTERQKEDKALVRRARGGEQRAFSELVKRHKRGIERLIRPIARTATTDEVEDLVQESLTKAFLHLDSYSEEYAFSTWLYRIATNHAIDHLRRKKLSVFSISAPPGNYDSKSDDDSKDFEITDSSWIPEEMMLNDERTRLIEEAIDQLPSNYKRIIRLRHNDDLEYEDIARVLNLPMGTVKVHLHRARAALGRLLDGKI
jgi:RNA polymerase sigma-70 factor (ECF subfamily)